MANEVDYLPCATGASAEVDTQAEFAGSGYQQNGFTTGEAYAAQANKIWRQTSMMSAAWANIISTTLDVSVLDDGNLPELISFLEQTIAALSQSSGASYQQQINTINGNVQTIDGQITQLQNTQQQQGTSITALQNKKITGSQSDVTGQRVFGTGYTNESGVLMLISGYGTTSGSGIGNLEAEVGGNVVYALESTATVDGGQCGFSFAVPAGATYQMNVTGAVNGLGKWIETLVQ